MEGTSHAARVTRASIRSTSIVIGGSGIEVADEAEASSDSNPDDVYVVVDFDPMSSSGDEFDDCNIPNGIFLLKMQINK